MRIEYRISNPTISTPSRGRRRIDSGRIPGRPATPCYMPHSDSVLLMHDRRDLNDRRTHVAVELSIEDIREAVIHLRQKGITI